MRQYLVIQCLVVCFLALGTSGVAQGASPTHEFDPLLSLRGDCTTSSVDKVPDPPCPEPGPHPPTPFNNPTSIAVDEYGDEYVATWGREGEGGRIDVFSPAGHYISGFADTFGAKSIAVDSEGNLYAFEQTPGKDTEIALYIPETYNPKAGDISYANSRTVVLTSATLSGGGGIAIDRSDDHLFITGGQFSTAIFEYSSAAEGNQLLNTITNEKLFTNIWVAVDAQRERLYASSCPERNVEKCWILVFESHAPFNLVEEVTGSSTPEGRFLSGNGWLSVAVDEESGHFFVDDLGETKNVYEFNEDYEYVSAINYAFNGRAHPLQIAVSNAPESPNDHYVFVPSHPGEDGHAFAFKPASERSPVVKSIAVDNVGEREAELQATILPEGGATHYAFEYMTQEAFEEAGGSFAGALVAGEGTVPSMAEESRVSAALNGLSPGTSYRFRVTAKSKAGEDEAESSFITYADAEATGQCPNQALRTGSSAALPDCRAYELVTPPNPNGRAPIGIGFNGDKFKTLEASPQGEAVSFFTEGGGLPGIEGSGAFSGSLYRSERGPSGWTTVSAGPSGKDSTFSNVGSTSPDQGYAFWTAFGEGPAVMKGAETHYVRYPDGHSELTGQGSFGTDPGAIGRRIVQGGAHVIFDATVQLEPKAPQTGTQAVYDRTADGVTHVVSLLPGDKTPAEGKEARYVGSSDDGAGIAFKIGATLYLRLNDELTYELGENLTFAGISEGGKRIFYLREGKLYAFDTERKEEIPFVMSGGPVTVVNVAPDGSRAYFVSTAALTGLERNPNGAVAKKGKENLYLSEEGKVRFVATVTQRDVEGEERPDGQTDGLGLFTEGVGSGAVAIDPSRTTPDGTVLLFESRANLDSYDPGGSPEIYRYDSVANRLHCISCIPTNLPATEGARLESIAPLQGGGEPFSSSGFVPNLRPDGLRVFFESTEPLVSSDTDETQDVYEWEEQGVGSCTRAEGCVYLISSGQSAADNYLYGVSQNGDDVFFITGDTLVAGDDETRSIYDARVNGGFPAEPSTVPCVGETCRPGLSPPPVFAAPAKAATGAKDNISRHCLRGERRVRHHGKTRCVKRHRRNHRHTQVTGKKESAK
ncbi:MAG: hypothetical protein ACTHK6_05300 [Solirubrobacterales bacterium]